MRFKGFIKRLRRDKTIFLQHRKLLADYLDENIIELVSNSEKSDDKLVFYLSHHTLLRLDSIYTKCRIVCDASAHDEGQISLNDCMNAGMNLSSNIFHLLLNFRFNKLAMLAYIEKAFLQISINENERDVLRLLFVDSNPIDKHFQNLCYRFRRLLLSLNASPYILSAIIKKNITSFQKE